MPLTVPPARNGLGAVTFVVVVLGAVLALFPATAAVGLLLCLLGLVPAVLAFRRTRRGTATNHRRATAAVLLAPVFLVVGLGVVARSAPPQVEPVAPASDARALADPAPAAPAAPLVAVPAPTSVAAPVVDPPTTVVAAAPRAAGSTGSAAKNAAPKNTAPKNAAPANTAPKNAPPANTAPRKTAPTSTAAQAAPSSADGPAPRPARAAPPAPPAPVVHAAAPTPTTSAGSAAACDDDTHYVNTAGNCVPRPVKAATAPEGATAKCGDGSYSFSQSRSGTCSHHGGVAEWL